MDFLLGILGILQITTMPGLIIHRIIRFRGNLFDHVLTVFGLSLISNYCLVFLLSAIGIYLRSVFVVFLVGEFIALIWLYRDSFRTPVDQIVRRTWDYLTNTFVSFIPKRQDNYEISVLSFAWLVLILFFAIKAIVWAGNVFSSNLGTVFSTWDAVVSWNRWATVWAASQIPMDSHFYPQLIPANWSLTYVLLGDTTLQFFAKSVMPLFGLLIFVGLFNLGVETGEYHFFVAMALLGPLLKNFLKDGISNGYVDIAVAFWGFMSVYLLIKAQRTFEFEQRYQTLLLGAVFAAGAAVTKQSGVYIALCYSILAWVVARSSDLSLWKERLKGFISHFALIYLIWVSWYLFKGIQILMGADRPNLDVLINLSSNTYGNVSLVSQLVAAIAQFDKFLILFIFIGLALPLMDRFYRWLTLLTVPYPLLWAWMAGYDTRNLAIFLPLFALISGYSVNILIQKFFEIVTKVRALRMPVYVPFILACIILVGLGIFISPRLHEKQVFLQKQNFSPETNRNLYDLIAAENSQTKILTNYPMQYLPGLERYQVRFDFQDQNVFLTYVQNPEIKYILFPNAVIPEIKNYIDFKIKDGSYELVWVNTEWKKFTLIKILKR